MNLPPPVRLRTLGAAVRAVLLVTILHPCLPIPAANLTWDTDGTAGGATGGTGIWDLSALHWNNAGTLQAWQNTVSHAAIFGGTAGTVTLGSPIAVTGMTFNSSGYSIVGGAHMLTLGGSVNTVTATHTASILADMTLSANTSFVGAGDLTIETGSTIAGAGFNLSKGNAGTLTLGAEIVDAGSLSVSGGVLDLTGSMTRTLYATAGSLSVSGGAVLNIYGTLGTSAAIPTAQTAFSGNSVTNIYGTAYMSGGSSTFRIGEGTNATVNVVGGTLTIGTSSAGVALGRGAATASGFLNISAGSMILASNTNVFRVGAGYSNPDNSGASVVTLSGTGLLETQTTTGTILLGSNLAGNTASTGTFHLDGGTLATNRTIIGGSAGASYFNFNGGTLKANGTTVTLASSLTTVNVRDGGGTLDTNGFDINIAKGMTHSDIEDDAAVDGGITKTGTGILTFSGSEANTYNGVTTLKAGELHLNKDAGVMAIAGNITLGDGTTSVLLKLLATGQIADTSVITLNGTDADAGLFQLNGMSETIGGLISTGGAGMVENQSATAATLTLNNVGSHNFSGLLRNGSLAGILSLTKQGAGTQILSSIATYTGVTTIDDGTLQFGVNSALTGTSSVIIAGAGSTVPATLSINGYTWTAPALTFYNATSTATSQGVIDIGTDGVLTLSSTLTVNNDNQPLGALITGGTLDFGGATRTFAIADSSNAVADLTITSNITSTTGGLLKTGTGTLRLTGGVTLAGGMNVSNGVLEVGGTVSTSTFNTVIGSILPGTLRLTGGSYSTTTASVGTISNQSGALIVTGGDFVTTTTSTSSGIRVGENGYGGLFLSGGTISTQRVDTWDGSAASSAAVIQISGGILNTANYIMLRNERWEFTMTGGEVRRTGDYIALGFRSGSSVGNATTTNQGAMTVAGGTVNNAGFLVTMGQQNNASALGTIHLNLNAGTLITNQIILYNSNDSGTRGHVNFNGGLLRASVSQANFVTVSGSTGTGSLTAYVNGAFGAFDGGAVIDSNGVNITIPIALLTPTGDGVSAIPLISGGSGYIGAPYVEITGGGGSGATASATVDQDPTSATYGQILSITVTNPGIGYTAAPTITLIGGGGTGAAIGTVTTLTNTSGGLTKSGTGILTLSGAAENTFTGTSQILAGELHLAKTAGVTALAGDIHIGDGSASAVLRLTNSNQIADTSVASFTGSGAAAGTFRLNNQSETIGGLSSSGGAGIVENESGSAATSTLTLQVASGIQTFSGILRNGDGSGTDGTLALVKSGAGTQVLSGLNTYTGSTTISAGILQLTGIGSTGTGAVTVANGSTLSGTGTVRGSSFTAASGAIIHAGDGTDAASFGTLQFSPISGNGTLDFQAGSVIILGLNPGGISDLLSFTGTSETSLLLNGGLTITAPGFTPTAEQTFNLLDWTGLISAPTFASHYSSGGYLYGNGEEATGLDLPDIYGSGYAWDLSQFTTNGSLHLIYVIPEPSRVFLLLVSLGCLINRRRR
ncbi:autotransporter-associated beta strand repeat-containing protein [Prosthecobacter sp. SYSU 5D2]|uniref:beta strand repeat-containing protein n=1 Tax=Prosthecobacter sp. SYSU 5D2 TaxID=3134134 RepID=UPI0031FE54F4